MVFRYTYGIYMHGSFFDSAKYFKKNTHTHACMHIIYTCMYSASSIIRFIKWKLGVFSKLKVCVCVIEISFNSLKSTLRRKIYQIHKVIILRFFFVCKIVEILTIYGSCVKKGKVWWLAILSWQHQTAST